MHTKMAQKLFLFGPISINHYTYKSQFNFDLWLKNCAHYGTLDLEGALSPRIYTGILLSMQINRIAVDLRSPLVD